MVSYFMTATFLIGIVRGSTKVTTNTREIDEVPVKDPLSVEVWGTGRAPGAEVHIIDVHSSCHGRLVASELHRQLHTHIQYYYRIVKPLYSYVVYSNKIAISVE